MINSRPAATVTRTAQRLRGDTVIFNAPCLVSNYTIMFVYFRKGDMVSVHQRTAVQHDNGQGVCFGLDAVMRRCGRPCDHPGRATWHARPEAAVRQDDQRRSAASPDRSFKASYSVAQSRRVRSAGQRVHSLRMRRWLLQVWRTDRTLQQVAPVSPYSFGRHQLRWLSRQVADLHHG